MPQTHCNYLVPKYVLRMRIIISIFILLNTNTVYFMKYLIIFINPSDMVSSGFGICFIKSEIVCLLEGVGKTAQVIDNRCVHNK